MVQGSGFRVQSSGFTGATLDGVALDEGVLAAGVTFDGRALEASGDTLFPVDDLAADVVRAGRAGSGETLLRADDLLCTKMNFTSHKREIYYTKRNLQHKKVTPWRQMRAVCVRGAPAREKRCSALTTCPAQK